MKIVTTSKVLEEVNSSLHYKGGYVFPGARAHALLRDGKVVDLSSPRLWSSGRFIPADHSLNSHLVDLADEVYIHSVLAGGEETVRYRRTSPSEWEMKIVDD